MKTEAAKRANLKWRANHPGAYEAYNIAWRKARRIRLIALLGGKCVRCGYQEHPAALDFDHIDPAEKEFTISNRLNRAWDRLLAEAKKCRLLCANCHRIRTHAPEMF